MEPTYKKYPPVRERIFTNIKYLETVIFRSTFRSNGK